MKEELIDFEDVLIDSDAKALAITTNGAIGNGGKAVMGAGIALLARNKFPDVEAILGRKLRLKGNVPVRLGFFNKNFGFREEGSDPLLGDIRIKWIEIWSFPTKHHWKDETSDIRLIIQSAKLFDWEMHMGSVRQRFAAGGIYIPRPGCAVGGLHWETVRSYIQYILTDSKYVIFDKPRVGENPGPIQG